MTSDDPSEKFVQPRAAAGVLFRDELDRILTVIPSYKDYFDIPGGYVEIGETPRAAAEREVEEELGIKLPVSRLLVVDWWTTGNEDNGNSKILFIFDGGILANDQLATLAPDGQEIVDYRLVDQFEVDSATIPRLANRIQTAVDAVSNKTTCYLENGL